MGNQNSAKKPLQTAPNPPASDKFEMPGFAGLKQAQDSDDEAEPDEERFAPSQQKDRPFSIKEQARPHALSRPFDEVRGESKESLQVVLTQHQELTLKEDEDLAEDHEKARAVEIAFGLGDDISNEKDHLPQEQPPLAVKRYFSAKSKPNEDFNVSNKEPDPKPQASGQPHGSKKFLPASKMQIHADWELSAKELSSKEDLRSKAQTRDTRHSPVHDPLELVTSATKSSRWSQTIYSTHAVVLKPSLIFELLGGSSKTIFNDEDFKHTVSNLVGHQRCRVDKDKKKL
jgi:hypothetical protein